MVYGNFLGFFGGRAGEQGVFHQPASEHIARSGQKKFSDIVWKVQRKGRKNTSCYIVILQEFQSTPDAFVALRLLSYAALLLEHLAKEPEVQQSEQLPPVLPIVGGAVACMASTSAMRRCWCISAAPTPPAANATAGCAFTRNCAQGVRVGKERLMQRHGITRPACDSQPAGAPIQPGASQPGVGGRHHLRRHRRELAVSDQHHRPAQPPHHWLEHG